MLVFGGASQAFAGQRNPDCLLCHEATQQFFVGAVDKDTACRACHTPGLLGTHPYHQSGSNCGAYCHPGWGESLLTATPSYLGSAGSFASPVSQDTTSAILHVIHSTPRWPSALNRGVSACSSCHAAAACTACHEGGVSATHEVHSSTTNTAWSGTVGFGIVGEDQTVRSATVQSNYCATPECHDAASLAASTPMVKEDFSHPAYPEYGYPEENVVTKTGTWSVKRGTTFTGGQQSYSNNTGATLSLPFTGNEMVLISDLDPYRGRAEIWIDGAYQTTIDCYSATTKYQRVVWTSPTLSSGPHTVMVKVLGTKSGSARAAWVNVDCFRVRAGIRESIAPDCTDSCHADKETGHGGSFTHEATQTVGTYPAGRFACTDCHSLSMWTEHGRTSSKTDPDGCAACHTTYADYTLDEYVNPARTGYGSCTWEGDGSVTGCHQVAAAQAPHNFADTDHKIGRAHV